MIISTGDLDKFTKVSHVFLNKYGDTLSGLAKFILIYIQSKRADWVVHDTDIAKKVKEGKHAIRTAKKALKENGFLHSIQLRETSGKFGEKIYLASWDSLTSQEAQVKLDKIMEQARRAKDSPLYRLADGGLTVVQLTAHGQTDVRQPATSKNDNSKKEYTSKNDDKALSKSLSKERDLKAIDMIEDFYGNVLRGIPKNNIIAGLEKEWITLPLVKGAVELVKVYGRNILPARLSNFAKSYKGIFLGLKPQVESQKRLLSDQIQFLNPDRFHVEVQHKKMTEWLEKLDTKDSMTIVTAFEHAETLMSFDDTFDWIPPVAGVLSGSDIAAEAAANYVANHAFPISWRLVESILDLVSPGDVMLVEDLFDVKLEHGIEEQELAVESLQNTLEIYNQFLADVNTYG
jgi:hypothetical protein